MSSNNLISVSDIAPYIAQRLGSPLIALNEGLFLLHKSRLAEPGLYEAEHKGPHFYWLGMAAFLTHDYQAATFFFDAAVSEDIKQGADPTKSETPALKFAYIKGDEEAQAARALVIDMQSKIEGAISGYKARPTLIPPVPSIFLDDIRNRFIRHALGSGKAHLRTLATAFISFFLEWNHRSQLAGLGIKGGTAEPFFVHLFKGCLLFESLLKENPTKQPKENSLGQILRKELYSELRIPPTIDVRSNDFSSIAKNIQHNGPIPDAIERSGRIRNTLGHNLGWTVSLDNQIYDSLAADVACCCIHAINCLYK